VEADLLLSSVEATVQVVADRHIALYALYKGYMQNFRQAA
jgi:hypothetical protein